VHPITELPQLLNPRGGYLQNTNDAPWYSTLEQRIDRAGFPDYMNDDAGLSFRGQISLRMLEAEKRLTLEKVARLKYNETFGPADRLKADLISLIRKRKGDSGDLREAAEILAHWDNRADVESHGAVLFIRWWEEYRRKASPIFKEPWSAARPLGSMRGIGDPDQALAALAAAVGAVRKEYLSLSVRWGDWHKLRRGNFEVPIGGSFGAFRSIGYRRDATGQWIASDGDSYVLAVEFTDPPTAVSVVAYSESANPESKHFSDQSEIFAHKGYKPVWFTEADIREHLERSYSAPAYTGPESPER